MGIIKTKKSARQCDVQLVPAKKPLAKGTDDQEVYSLEFDGASKGNPGKAGAGAILKCPNGTVLCQLTKGVGIATCNFAEYQALIMGLQAALDQGIHRIKAQGDSKLVCNQVMGEWQVRSDNLSPSFAEAVELTKRFQVFSIQHVYRESNRAADALANSAVRLPQDEPVGCQNSRPDQQMMTTTISSKSAAQNLKDENAVEDPNVATKAFELPECSSINEEYKKKFYCMDYHGAASRKYGKASVGALLHSPDGSLCLEIKQGLGQATRNVAHYQALVIGLRAALECNVSHIIIQGDALLIFKQMTGQVKVKDESLVALWKEANSLLTRFTAFSIKYVEKCKNPAACALAKATVHSSGCDNNMVDAQKTSGLPNMDGCVAVQGQNSSYSRTMTQSEIPRSMDSVSIASKKFVVGYSLQVNRPCQHFSCSFYCQTSQTLQIRPAHPSPCPAAVLKSLPLYAANTSIHQVALRLPSKRLRCIPHIFQSSLMHIAGGTCKSAFSSTHSFR